MWPPWSWGPLSNFLQNHNLNVSRKDIVHMKALIIDDDGDARQELETAFRACKEISFDIESAADMSQADGALRRTRFDVITIDLKFGSNVTAGLQWMQRKMILASCPDAIKIVVTAYPTYPRCVEAMRLSAWDFIDKEGNYGVEVVRSAVARLMELEEAKRVQRFIFDEWLPAQGQALQKKYPGEYVAVDSEGRILAHGDSMITLGAELPHEWLTNDRKPYILHIAKEGIH